MVPDRAVQEIDALPQADLEDTEIALLDASTLLDLLP